jgi:GNAT superfamily N-acetyltransferase
MTHEQPLETCFGSADSPPGDVVLQVWSGDAVLSHVDVYWRSVAVGSNEIPVAAIGQVATDPAFRGLGLASVLVEAAHRMAAERRLALDGSLRRRATLRADRLPKATRAAEPELSDLPARSRSRLARRPRRYARKVVKPGWI